MCSVKKDIKEHCVNNVILVEESGKSNIFHLLENINARDAQRTNLLTFFTYS